MKFRNGTQRRRKKEAKKSLRPRPQGARDVQEPREESRLDFRNQPRPKRGKDGLLEQTFRTVSRGGLASTQLYLIRKHPAAAGVCSLYSPSSRGALRRVAAESAGRRNAVPRPASRLHLFGGREMAPSPMMLGRDGGCGRHPCRQLCRVYVIGENHGH